MLVFKLKSAKTPALVIKPSDSEVGNMLVVNAGDRAPRIPARAWLAASTVPLVNKPHSHISIFETLNRAARSPVLFILFLHLRRTSASVLEIL